MEYTLKIPNKVGLEESGGRWSVSTISSFIKAEMKRRIDEATGAIER